MDNLLYKFSLVAINNQILLQSYDEKEKLKLEVKSKWNRIFLNYLNSVFQLAVEEQEKKLKEFVTPDFAFLFCVKIDEVKDMQFPKDCSNLNDFYFNIYIVNNKKKDHNKLSYCDEDLHVNRNSCIRRSLTEKCEVINYHRTSVYRKNQKPVDEEFQFQLQDINSTQDLVIECYSYNEDDYNQKFVFKKAWRSLKQFLDNKRFCKEFIGQVKLPIKSLKDSDDLWFNMLCKHNDISHSIRAKVKLRITFKFENEKMHRNSSFNLLSSAASAKAIRPEDQFVAKSATGNNYLAREYHRLCQIVYDYEKKQQNKQNPNEKWNGMITELSIAFLKRFCDTFFIPNFAKELIELTTFVEKARSDEVNTTGEYELITRRFTSFLAKYEKNLSMAKEVFEGADEDVNLLKTCAVDLITNYFSRFSNTFRTFPIFSSPHQPSLQLLIDTFTSFHRLFVHISKAKAEELKNLFVEKLTNKVWDDVNFFINDVVKFEEANESDDSRSLKWISNLSSTIQNLNEYINDANFKKNLLSDHFNYQKSVSLRISIALCNPIRLAIKLMNDYQKIYRQFLPNMLESSKVSCELYLSCTDLIKLLKMHVPDRELFKFKLNNYSDWFQEKEMFTFWLETYDIILRHYFNNAIFSENFGPAAEHVTYSDTAVVLANNLLNMLNEWNKINFQNLELKCVGIGSMSEIITTYCRRYAIDIRETLEKANYFFESGELSIQSFMTSLNKISIYVNNIRFIKKQVLDDLAKLLNLNETIKNCERYSENDNLIDVIKSAVHKSIEEALKDLNTITTTIINEINNRLKKQVETLVFNLIEYNEATEFLNFIDNCLKFLVKHFSDHSSKITKNLRSNVIRLLVRYLPEKKVWKAYVHIVQFLNQIDLIYYDYGYPPIIEDQINDPSLVKDPPELTEEINKLIEKLYVYSKPTSSLILDYLQYVNQIDHLVQSFGTTYSVFYYKLAFEESNDGQININLKIISCNNVKVDRFKTSDAYILVELMPYSLFDGQNKKISQIVKKSENLFLNESFEFKNLSLDSFQTAGATLRLSLWEKDKNGLCTCLGECFHPLEHIEMMKPHHKTLNDMPAVKKILGRTPKENLECLEELERRVEFDNEAREFKRSREMKVQCIEVKSPGCGITYEATLNKVNDLLDCVKCFPVNELLTFMRKKVE